ncbi:MAG TPA: STAS domain-containing protein [Pirellulales bacterium]|nr:STAS domain-containing protein [Pirellulales bacterium]
MQASSSGLSFEVDRGPDWVFVRVNPPEAAAVDAPQLAEAVWALLEQTFVYRVVLELDRIQLLRSYMVGQLILLSKRIHTHGGVLRICGLSSTNEEVLRCCQLAGQLPNYRDRGDAVMCSRPKPR